MQVHAHWKLLNLRYAKYRATEIRDEIGGGRRMIALDHHLGGGLRRLGETVSRGIPLGSICEMGRVEELACQDRTDRPT